MFKVPLTRSYLLSLFMCLVIATQGLASTQFSSHVSINTPSRSFSHGVGNPVPLVDRRTFHRQQNNLRSGSQSSRYVKPGFGGYPRVRPTIPFNVEERPRGIPTTSLWQHRQSNTFIKNSIPILPLSPYKVDSPDPESLWPEGLFLPPLSPPRLQPLLGRRSDKNVDSLDPYLLEGSEAIAAVKRADTHGHLFFHDIPHIDSLLANQEVRVKNNLKPHRIASIRHTWPYNRP